MQHESLQQILSPVLADIAHRSTVAESFIDKDLYRICMATLWANLVLNPADANIEESQLEDAYAILNEDIPLTLGAGEDLVTCFTYLNGKAGERAMLAAKLNQTHKDMLLYFASMMIDPEGHRRWLDEIREDG